MSNTMTRTLLRSNVLRLSWFLDLVFPKVQVALTSFGTRAKYTYLTAKINGGFVSEHCTGVQLTDHSMLCNLLRDCH